MDENYIDISYNGRVKSKYSFEEITKKIQNFIKKNKLKNWKCEVSNAIISINFNDNISDIFILEITDFKFEGNCRISYDDKQKDSTLECLLDMFYSIKSIFTKFSFEDDFSICEAYLQNKNIGINLIEITEDEIKLINTIYDNEYKDYREFILQYVAYNLSVSSWKDLYVNLNAIENKWFFDSKEKLFEEIFMHIIETFLYEVCTYKDYGRFSNLEFFNKNNIAEYQALNEIAFDEVAFCNGIQNLFFNRKSKNSFGIKDAKIKKFYNEIVGKTLEENNKYNQCIIAYRYFKTILAYTNFQICERNEQLFNINQNKYFKFTNGVGTSVQEALKYILEQ